MEYFYIEPEVSGGLGPNTLIDQGAHPPIVKKLEYRLEGWLGDAILESFPVFVVTEEAQAALLDINVSGVVFDEVEITTSSQFEELYPGRNLPLFVWLRPKGRAGLDDIGIAADNRLVVSQRALDALTDVGIAHALTEPFDVSSE